LAIATISSRVADALQMQAKYNSAYLVIGKSSPWTDEENPPKETDDVTAISEVIGYKKAKKFSIARPLRSGETAASVGYPVITYRSQQWALVPTDKAYTEKAHWIYFEAELLQDDFPPGKYRQVGVHLGLTPRTGVTKQNLLPSEVSDVGTLRFYENRKGANRDTNVYALEQFMIKL
jgi:hypothetical protein